jgi:UDP-N-acetyl-2-amino-2-deoxyglucuronate dehydrogenase
MESFGYGIIGCGWVSSAHAWGVKVAEPNGVRLVAVADQDLARATHLGERFGAENIVQDYKAILARDDIAAVSICLPDFLHHEVALAAAAAGKHILCEKPLALNIEQADEILAACTEADVSIGLIMNHRYFPDNIAVWSAIQRGALGRPLIASAIHSSCLTGDPAWASDWRGKKGMAAGGILTTQAIHFLDLLLWFGGPAASVSAMTDTLVRHEQDYEDTAVVSLRLQSGAIASLTTTNGAPIEDDFTGTRLEVQGTAGYIMTEGDQLRFAVTSEGGDLKIDALPDLPEGADEVIFGHGHVHEVGDFIRAVRSNERPPIPAADGRHLMAVLDAAAVSAATGQAVDIDEPTDAYRSSPSAGSLLGGQR